jgi:predicted nucleic acid-binding protein
MYLVDTNVWLERLLDQERSAEVGQFLSAIASDELLMSDFSLHSIGIILDRLGQRGTLPQFVNDLFVDGQVTLVAVPPQAMGHLVARMEQFSLDFDDAYQNENRQLEDTRSGGRLHALVGRQLHSAPSSLP